MLAVKRYLPMVLLALTVGGLYLPLARYGYVHDDNVMIESFTASGSPGLSPVDTHFYRPLGTLYCYAVFALFGMNTVGFHLLAITLLFMTALAVQRVAAVLAGDGAIAWGTAFLYAGAAHLHLDAQMWMVGIFDNGTTLFSLLCLLAFMRGRPWPSALFLAIALGFKETAVPIVVVAGVWALLQGKERKTILRLWPHAIVLVAWIIIKSVGISPSALPDDHPYAWNVVGWHVLENIGLYVTWFVPVPFGFLLILSLMGWTCISTPRTGVLLIVWALLMLLPASMLLQHAFRYYAILALPPIALGVLLGLRALPIPRRWQVACVIVLVTVQFTADLFFIQGHVRRGINDDVPATDDGYNHLIRRSLQGE